MLIDRKISSNTLILLETAAQAEAWATQANQGLMFAITPEAAYACQKLGLSYQKIEAYAQVTKRLSEYAPVLKHYLEWEAWLDQWAQQSVPEFETAGFAPASAATYLLQYLFAEIWAVSVNLQELLKTIQPTQIALWPPAITHVPLHLHPLISPLTALAPAVASRYDIDFIDLSDQAPELKPVSPTLEHNVSQKSFGPWIKGWLRQQPFITDIVQEGLKGLWPYLILPSHKALRILFSGYTYDLSSLARALRRQGVNLTVISDTLSLEPSNSSSRALTSDLSTKLTTAWECLLQEPELWRPLEQWGITEHIPLWSKPLQAWWYQLVPELWRNFQRVQQLLSQHKFAALVTWDASGTTLSSGATNAAKMVSVPRYLYQHGGSAGLEAKQIQLYLRHSDTLLAYGQHTVADIRQSCPSFLQTQTQIVSVGSARLDLLRQHHRPEKAQRLRAQLQTGDPRPLIMYIPTCFGAYGRAISDLAAYPDVPYFELQQAILKLWQKAPTVRLLYKEFITIWDARRVMSDFISEHIPDAIVTNQRLSDLMWAVDAIVLDHVISAAGEILLTNKPVLIYMPQPNTFNPPAKALLQKRATVAETPDEFMTQVEALLQAPAYPELTQPNQEFLEAYCTHLNDGRSAERAASLILQQIRAD